VKDWMGRFDGVKFDGVCCFGGDLIVSGGSLGKRLKFVGSVGVCRKKVEVQRALMRLNCTFGL
jgi:hypothetical protein